MLILEMKITCDFVRIKQEAAYCFGTSSSRHISFQIIVIIF